MTTARDGASPAGERLNPLVPGAGRCVSCGADALVDYCARCGERRASPRDYSLGRFLSHAFHVVTDVDSRLLRTAGLLLTRPGTLAAEHFAGRRKPYLGPLQTFLVFNVAFFLLYMLVPVNIFTITLSDHLRHQLYSPWLLSLDAGGGTTYGQLMQDRQAYFAYSRIFHSVTTTQAKSLVILMVPVFALGSHLLHGPRRWFYAQHLVHSLHFFAFLLLLVPVTGVLTAITSELMGAVGRELTWQEYDLLLSLLTGTILAIYLASAGKCAFGGAGWSNAARAVLLVLFLMPILSLYRFILFFTTRAVL